MTGIDSYLNSYLSPYINSYGTNSASSASPVFDVAGAQASAKQQASDLLDSLKNSKSTVTTLKKESAAFLDQYSVSMKKLGQSADKLRFDGMDKLLYDREGKVTDETVSNTVKAVQDMVTNYNDTIKLLNDNAERGPGAMKQLARMVDDIAPESTMEMVGMKMKDDGTLELDTAKLTEALKTENPLQLDLYKEFLGGVNGIADGVQKDALFGSNVSARDLISNDLVKMSSAQSENPFREMYDSFRGSAYGMMNQAVSGMLMNILA